MNVAATLTFPGTNLFGLRFISSYPGNYHLVVSDGAGNTVADGILTVTLPRSTPLDAWQSAVIVPSGGINATQPGGKFR